MSNFDRPERPSFVRHISRGACRIECYVIHRDAKVVKYHFGDTDRDGKPDTVYEKTPADFDAAYQLPAAPVRR